VVQVLWLPWLVEELTRVESRRSNRAVVGRRRRISAMTWRAVLRSGSSVDPAGAAARGEET